MRASIEEMDKREIEVLSLKEKGFNPIEMESMLHLTKKEVEGALYRQSQKDSRLKHKVKRAEMKARYYAANKDKIHQMKQIRIAELKEMWIPKGADCVICGKIAEHRHHLSYKNKSFDITQLYDNPRKTIPLLEDEKAKTILLCQSCHRLIHTGGFVNWADYWDGELMKTSRKEEITWRIETVNDMFLNGDTYAQIAEKLNITNSQVKYARYGYTKMRKRPAERI